MRDKSNILNEVVMQAADLMEMKAQFNELVAKQMEQKGDLEVAERLRSENSKTMAAVEHMRVNAGCWN